MLHIGVNLGFGNLHENLPDHRMVENELKLAELADRLGYDSLWAVEHHFDDYAMLGFKGSSQHRRVGSTVAAR